MATGLLGPAEHLRGIDPLQDNLSLLMILAIAGHPAHHSCFLLSPFALETSISTRLAVCIVKDYLQLMLVVLVRFPLREVIILVITLFLLENDSFWGGSIYMMLGL